MAYTNGTATDYKDLLAAAATFWAANGATVLDQTAEKVYFKATGLSGTDGIYCGVETYELPASSYYNWELFGSWGFRSGRGYERMPHSSGDEQAFSYFWNTSMPYWMAANGRRLIGFAKVGTYYMPFHLGLLKEPAIDKQYPCPLLIGGAGNTKARSYSYSGHSGFWASQAISGRLHRPDGRWATVYNNSSSSEVYPAGATFGKRDTILSSPDGVYAPEEIALLEYAYPNTLGIIDGLYRVSGYNNSAENIITVDSVNYIVFPDIYRTEYDDFCCMRMS